MRGCEYTSRAGPSPKVLHPTPTHLPQPMQPLGLLHVSRAGPTHFGRDVWSWFCPTVGVSGDLPRPVPRQIPTGALLMAETQRVGLPAGITASAGRLEGPATMPLLTESLPDSTSGISIFSPSSCTGPTHLIHPESPGLESKGERGILAVYNILLKMPPPHSMGIVYWC